ncbi:TetR/AcrR family transcriptional regulator [Plantibacter sp. VKM Ac-2876]|uniref:TetR/AcrR family transcriptional regulator n=1 Tax=Plantibacter sp. VKM Ac-2876 TaxID=2783826 RepID=UPI00188BC496|nr:TetR/AcrR family transcriptional regulator [Plantibacter sp. VKM Ac-2876]
MPVSRRVSRAQQMSDRILDAALDLMRSRGSVAVNIEAVAETTGVAKTTIYRRYRNRSELLTAAVARAMETPVEIPESLSTYDTFTWLLHEARAMIEDVVGRGTIASILLQDDPEFSTLLRDLTRNRARALSNLVDERISTGDLKPGLDGRLVATLLLGAVLGQLVRGADMDDDWADQVLSVLWPALAA